MSVLETDPGDRIQILESDGSVRSGATVPPLDDATMVAMYRDMKRARRFDDRAVNLQRQGRMGTFPPMSGQEGAQVGSAYALDDEDWVVPSYREHAVAMVHGVELKQILLYWMGHEAGNAITEANVFPVAVPIATQLPHAMGLAWAGAMQGQRRVVACYFGDGGTSEGDFHEALNFAGVFDTPNVFCCMNNQWAISVPRERQTASETLAQKADAYGLTGVQVDGMDPLATYAVTRAAVERAKQPEPDHPRSTLIEAVQYRFGAHTTADDPSVYREEAEVEAWRDRDPIYRFERYLLETDRLDEGTIGSIEQEIEDEVRDAVEAAESTPRPEPREMFEHVYAEPPADLAAQRDELEELREVFGDDALLE